MATDATGTPTTIFDLPKYDTANDAPSGLGFNAAMDAIDAAIATRPPKPADVTGVGFGLGWDGDDFTVVDASSWGGVTIPTTGANEALGWDGSDFSVVDTTDAGVADMAYTTFTNAATTTATTAAAAGTIVTAAAFTAVAATNYWLEFWCGSVKPPVGGRSVFVTLWLDGVAVGTVAEVHNTISGSNFDLAVPVIVRIRLSPAAGSRTYAIKAWFSGGAGTATFDGSLAAAPGYIRIVKA